jgi:hypothetical protein
MHTEPIQQLWPQFPSSGLPEPTKMNRAGWLIEIPSRSTVFHPEAAESNKTSTR